MTTTMARRDEPIGRSPSVGGGGSPTKESGMQRILISVVLLVTAFVCIRAVPSAPSSAATPQAATPVSSPTADALATRVADLKATVAAQSRAQLDLALRVDTLEQGLAPVLAGLPDQVATMAF